MTLNGVIAFIFLYFTEFDSFAGLLLQWLPIVSAEYRLPRLAKTDPPCSAVSLRQLSYLYYVQNRHCDQRETCSLHQQWPTGLRSVQTGAPSRSTWLAVRYSMVANGCIL